MALIEQISISNERLERLQIRYGAKLLEKGFVRGYIYRLIDADLGLIEE